MIEITKRNLENAGSSKVSCILRDVLEEGAGLKAESAYIVLLFNILHFSERRKPLAEASRILKKGGIVAIIHWRKDIPTPRGPAIEARPDMDQILSASEGLSLHLIGGYKIQELYHWGMKLSKGISQ